MFIPPNPNPDFSAMARFWGKQNKMSLQLFLMLHVLRLSVESSLYMKQLTCLCTILMLQKPCYPL